MIDWTKVLGSAVFVGGAIANMVFSAMPIEVSYTFVALATAIWGLPPIWSALNP